MTDSSQPMKESALTAIREIVGRLPPEWGDASGEKVLVPIAVVRALAVQGEQVPVGWKDALKNLETACENLAVTRSQATYLSMLDVDGAQSQLEALDMARREARAMLSSAPASPVREREKIIEECAKVAELSADPTKPAFYTGAQCAAACIRALKDSHHD